MICVKFDWKWSCGSAEGDFSNSSMYFHYFVIFPLEKAEPFIWTILNSMHSAKFGWNWPSGFGEEDFLNLSMYFRNFLIISLWKRMEPFIWTNLNFLLPRMPCAKYGWNWPSGWKCEKFTTTTMIQQQQQHNKGQRTTDDQKSSLQS